MVENVVALILTNYFARESGRVQIGLANGREMKHVPLRRHADPFQATGKSTADAVAVFFCPWDPSTQLQTGWALPRLLTVRLRPRGLSHVRESL